METVLCLVRHGATDWNFDMRAQGHFDQPLNEIGRLQAKLVADRLGTQQWDVIYASDLSRARDTAAALAERLGLPVHLEPGLRERNMGSVEGITIRDRRMRYGTPFQWREMPGVESDHELQGRTMQALTQIAEAHRGQRVVCVSHGGTLNAFLTVITGTAPTAMQRNTSVTLVRYNGTSFVPELTACHTHLLEPSGLEYSGEKGRIRPEPLRQLYRSCTLPEAAWDDDRLQALVELSASAWGAWEGDRLVAFARGLTDGVSIGVIDRCALHPDWQESQVLHDLINQIKSRFPLVEWIER